MELLTCFRYSPIPENREPMSRFIREYVSLSEHASTARPKELELGRVGFCAKGDLPLAVKKRNREISL